MNKKYNPFKMWGSYVGAVLAPILVNVVYFKWILDCGTGLCDGPGLAILATMGIPIQIIIGFLIGWGTEYLLRKNKII